MDKMKNLFVNGCSFLNWRMVKKKWVYKVKPEEGYEQLQKRKHHYHVDLGDESVKFSTAECIKDLCEFESMTNLARGGRGNDRIFLTTVSYFENEPKRKKDTFVMIGWTSAERLDYPTRYEFKPMEPLDECWATMKIADDNIENFTKMSKQGRKGGADELDVIHWMITRYYQNVLGLQNYLKVNKIPYVFYNSLQPILEDEKKDHKWWLNAIDQKHFFNIDTSQHQFCHQNDLLISKKDGHPSADGHKLWAGKIYKYIQKQGLQNEI